MTGRRIAIHTDGRLVQGNERQIELIARGLVQRGHTVHIAATPDTPAWDRLAATGAFLSSARPRGAADVISAFRFGRWLRSVRPDAVLLTSWKRLWVTARVARLARMPNIVLRLGSTPQITPGWRGAHYRVALRRHVDRIYVNSSVVRDRLLQLADIPPERVHLVWNALAGAAAEAAPVRVEIALAPATPIVAAVGGLARNKRFDMLIRAFTQVDTRAHLVICGQGTERAALDALAASLAIADRVHLLGQRDDVPAILAAADVFVLCSRREGFSVAMLEAMQAGLPVIATDIGGVRDALCDDSGAPVAGWIVPPDDEQALATTLRAVLASRHTDDTRARATEARRRAADYTLERMIEGVERVLFPDAAIRAGAR